MEQVLSAEKLNGGQVAPDFAENKSAFHQKVADRFRLVPNFFVSTPDAPEIIERLWAFAAAAYLDNPIPTLFKERLFVFLSRFCPVRYCIARHCGFLLGYGNSSGDASAQAQTIDQVRRLLTMVPPWRRQLDAIYNGLAAIEKPVDWPAADSELEDWLFTACAVIFVRPAESERARNGLRQALGGKRLEYLLALLAFIRTAHFWTEVHPGIEMEDDIKRLMSTHKELAALLLKEPDIG